MIILNSLAYEYIGLVSCHARYDAVASLNTSRTNRTYVLKQEKPLCKIGGKTDISYTRT
jgi:hypothetical protein